MWIRLGLVLVIAWQATTARAADATVVTTFPADRGPGYKVIPDTQGAVGPKHVVDFDGLNFIVHDKETGRVLVKKSQREFWASVEPAETLIAPKPWDPRFLYDATSRRWIGVIASDGHGHGYLAVSTTSDPTDPWNGVVLPMDKQDLGFKLGVDKNGLYATYASAAQGRDIHSLHDCFVIPKEDLLAPDGPSLESLTTFTRLEHDSFPATDLNPKKAAGDPEVILNKEFGDDCGQLYMYKITWQGKTASISEKQVIPLRRKYRSPNTTLEAATAQQPSPGITIRAPRRTIAVAQYGDSVYQCNNAKLDDESGWGVFWCEVRVSDGELIQEGFFDDPDGEYLIPSLAVDKDGNIGFGCTRTSAAEFPSAYVTMQAGDATSSTKKLPESPVVNFTCARHACCRPQRNPAVGARIRLAVSPVLVATENIMAKVWRRNLDLRQGHGSNRYLALAGSRRWAVPQPSAAGNTRRNLRHRPQIRSVEGFQE